MSVTPVRSAMADILFYRNDLRDWRKPDGTEVGSSSEAGKAVVHVVQGEHGYQIFAVRVRDEQMLVNQQLYENFHYKVATPVFHQWKNEQKQVIGLSFQNPDEAISFSRAVKEIVEALGGQPQQQQYQQIINVSNGVYQDPQTLYQQNHRQQQQQPQYPNNNKDLDQESIGSGHSAAGMTNYRQSQQKSSYSSLQNGTLNQQQRRCSQGSSGSGSTPSSSNIYQAATPLTSNYGQSNGHHSNLNGSNGIPVVKAPVPPPPPPPQQLNGSSSNNGTSSNVAQVSKNAPPPPPPPPPGGLSLSSGGSSLADQLKNATLRKSSAPVNRTSSDVSQQQPQPKTSVAGAQNLMSELAAKLGSRNTGKACNADNVSTSSSSGVSTASSSIGVSSAENVTTDSSTATMVGTKKSSTEVPSTPSAPKPWSKPNGVAGITAAAAGTLESPKGQRKVINASNSVEAANSSSSIISADLEQFKHEILGEVNKTKEEISEIRQDISKLLKTQQEIFETLRAVLNQR